MTISWYSSSALSSESESTSAEERYVDEGEEPSDPMGHGGTETEGVGGPEERRDKTSRTEGPADSVSICDGNRESTANVTERDEASGRGGGITAAAVSFLPLA